MKDRLYVMILISLIFEVFMIGACSEKEEEPIRNKVNSNELIVKGSDSEYELMNELLNQFSKKENGVKFRLSGAGSGKGIEALINGEINIAASSRELNPEEKEWALQEGVDAKPLIFALDAVAFISHPMNGVDSLSPEQLRMIFAGEIKNWKELGGTDIPVVLIGRNEYSGTNGYIFNKLHLSNWSNEIIEYEHGTEVYEAVKKRKGSIGYLSLGTIVSPIGKPVSDVWAINIFTDYAASISPYEIGKVQNGEYYFSRPLYLYFDGLPQGLLKKFKDYLLSDDTQNELWNHGYFPLTESQIKINEKNKIN
jgi:phosphate transport system substrate-binding protein